MSYTVVTETDNQIHVDREFTKLRGGNCHYVDGDITASGADVVLVIGMVLGRVAATNKLTPLVATATDGSQFPVGVVIASTTIVDGTTETITVVNKGTINESLINFLGAETLATTIGLANNLKTIRDLMNDLGFILETSTDAYKYDN